MQEPLQKTEDDGTGQTISENVFREDYKGLHEMYSKK